MAHQSIVSNQAPAPIGPYSQAVRSGSMLFCSGQVALDPVTGELVAGDVRAQAEQVMRNMGAVLEAAGGSVETVDGAPLRYGKAGFTNPHFIAFGRRG